MMKTHVSLVYIVALSLFVAAASISAPLKLVEVSDTHVKLCDILAQKMPCDSAGGTLDHVCRASVSITCTTLSSAIQGSRHMPQHICTFVQAFLGATGSSGNNIHFRNVVKVVGMVLGMGLMLLGRVLYKPCLFFMPCMIIGCTLIQPLAPQFHEYGLTHAHTSAIGSLVGLLLALLQRHVMVWLLGVLVGIMGFVAALIFTPVLSNLAAEALLLVGIVCALLGSSIVGQLEKTSLWKVSACALVGSLLFTDAIGVRHVWEPLQVWVCALLVISSSWQQLRRRSDAPSPERGNKKHPHFESDSPIEPESTVQGFGAKKAERHRPSLLWTVIATLSRLLTNSFLLVWRFLRGGCVAVCAAAGLIEKHKVD